MNCWERIQTGRAPVRGQLSEGKPQPICPGLSWQKLQSSLPNLATLGASSAFGGALTPLPSPATMESFLPTRILLDCTSIFTEIEIDTSIDTVSISIYISFPLVLAAICIFHGWTIHKKVCMKVAGEPQWDRNILY